MFTRETLDQLLSKGKDKNLSLYLSTGFQEKDPQQGKIKLKNLLKEGESQLLKQGVKKSQLKKYTGSIEKLIEDTKFWNNESKGIAIFATEEDFQYYSMPVDFASRAFVTDELYIQPLFPVFQRNGQFYILAISQNDLRLLHCTRDDVREIKLENVPTSIHETLQYDVVEKQIQFSTKTPSNIDGKRSAVFHGQGFGMEDEKVNILRYCQEIDAGLSKQLINENIPLILAGVQYLFPIYKEANKLPNLLDEGIIGNPEEFSNKELQKKGWSIIEPYFKKEEMEAIAKYNNLLGTGKSSNDIHEIVSAAYNQKIEALLVTKGKEVWGCYDKENNSVELHPEEIDNSQELLNFAAIHTFTNGGKVYVIEREEMPENTLYLAIFRY
ncbi:hypothetical protein SAMN05660297_01454 [Natronincola peptidivorans]|uniref:Uncharacterized protein n=1 Tax=Natronincola peptidivorans TaxID=426128 RepID=A0A1I0BWG9_9FIRM|nr:hypothetical protein [Natronincola peptidivorans]SET11445.1 hypothetical protein SAMN05660297_01454 [Natronincola peptidivorans]